MGSEHYALIVLGAIAGGIVNGMTGFGTGLTVLSIWLYVLSPVVASTLVILCSVVSQLQTLPMIWRAIMWRRVLVFALPGFAGVPIGTFSCRISTRGCSRSRSAFCLSSIPAMC